MYRKKPINEVVVIDIAELRALHEETLCHEWLGCVFKTAEGADYVTGLCIILNDFNDKRLEINNKAVAYGKELSIEIYESIAGRIDRQNLSIENNDNVSLYWYAWQLKDIVSQTFIASYVEANDFADNFYEAAFDHLGISSVAFVKMIIDLENEFSFEFDIEMLAEAAFPSVEAMMEYVMHEVERQKQ